MKLKKTEKKKSSIIVYYHSITKLDFNEYLHEVKLPAIFMQERSQEGQKCCFTSA